MLYHGLLVSAIHHHESAIGTCTSPASWASSLTSHPIHPSRLSQSTGSELPVLQSTFPLAISFTRGNGNVSMLLSQFIPSSTFHPVSTSLFFMSLISTAALQIGSSVPPSFQILCVCVNVEYVFFSFRLSSLCIKGSKFIHLFRTESNAFLFMAVFHTI